MAQETSEGLVILLTIDHADMTNPIRVSSTTESFVSNVQTYLPCPFLINLPSDDAETIQELELQVQNVVRDIVAGIRAITPGSAAPTVTMEVVTVSLPDTVEVGPLVLSLRSARYDRQVVTGALGYAPILDQPYPSSIMGPNNFAGMF
jgi:hypothetical protein